MSDFVEFPRPHSPARRPRVPAAAVLASWQSSRKAEFLSPTLRKRKTIFAVDGDGEGDSSEKRRDTNVFLARSLALSAP